MPQPTHLDPAAYAADGGPVGILLIHGYAGSVAETRPMGEYLAARDLTVRCPLLPGHGTSPQDLTRIQWQAWAGEVGSALRDLQSRCETVFVGGLSLGSLLTLWLGAQHATIAGLIPMAPALKVRNRLLPAALGLRYLFKYNPLDPMGHDDLGDPEAIDRIWCYDEEPLWGAAELYLLQRRVRGLLSNIHQPVLIFQGRRDAQLHPQSVQILYDELSSTDKTIVWLESSGHNLLADGERESVWAQSYTWMHALSGAEGQSLSGAEGLERVPRAGN
jgi:carboxylesterase